MTASTWRSHLPPEGQSNRWFHWCPRARGGAQSSGPFSSPDETSLGVHVPTKVGCDLLASALLPFGERLAAFEVFFQSHPEARELRAGK